MQEGLAHYEIENGRVRFHGPEANIADAVQKLSAGNHGGGAPSATADAAPGAMPAWQQALAKVHLPLYDVHWAPAVILKSGKRGDEALMNTCFPCHNKAKAGDLVFTRYAP